MRVAFRVDASITIGVGHVMRCLVLADELLKRGVDTLFICRDFDGNLAQFIKHKGHGVFLLDKPSGTEEGVSSKEVPPHTEWLGVEWEVDCDESLNALGVTGLWDWLVIDHYSIDARCESRLRSKTLKILVIDDLADRPHDCDILLDQSYCGDEVDRYKDVVPLNCDCLVGLKYVLLRPEFIEARRTCTRKREYIKRIFLNFGGADKPNATKTALDVVKKHVPTEVMVDVVVGMSNQHLDEIKITCADTANINLYMSCNNMAELMYKADLAIGCGGVTALERAYLGLPSLVISNAENQKQAVADMAQKGMLIQYFDQQDLENKIKSVLESGIDAVTDLVGSGTSLITDKMMIS